MGSPTDGSAVELDGLTHLRSGKVRDIYAADEDHLLLVASDRISTYDCVHPTLVPDKGRVLTGLSAFWFDQLADVVDNHLVTTDLDRMPAAVQRHADHLHGRTMLVRRVEIVPFECVVRGHLAGSGWREYRRDQSVCGVSLPPGLEEASRLDRPIFTPATKAADGDHDENVPFERVVAEVGDDLAGRLRDTSIALFSRARDLAADRGIVLADTKFEFGLSDGALVLADEVLTPDSSRYWPADQWRPGSTPPSFDKQFVRDHVTDAGWDHSPPAPPIPPEVVAATRARYVEAYERLTGQPFAAWLAR